MCDFDPVCVAATLKMAELTPFWQSTTHMQSHTRTHTRTHTLTRLGNCIQIRSICVTSEFQNQLQDINFHTLHHARHDCIFYLSSPPRLRTTGPGISMSITHNMQSATTAPTKAPTKPVKQRTNRIRRGQKLDEVVSLSEHRLSAGSEGKASTSASTSASSSASGAPGPSSSSAAAVTVFPTARIPCYAGSPRSSQC